MGSAVLEQLERYGPERCPQLDYAQASAYVAELARTHYENFTVVSWLLPRRLREDFRHVYAFCRWADDLGDETGDRAQSLELLAWWRRELDACYAGQPRHPVYVALAETIRRHDIPRQPFDDLIDAFVQDQTVTRYDTWEQVLDYCTRSANPVGRLVLYLCGYRDPERQRLSDATCTALQLANFWQDVRRDILERDRVYIPDEVAREHGLDVELMVQVVRADAGAIANCQLPIANCQSPRPPEGGGCCRELPSAGMRAVEDAYQATVRDLVDRTWPLFAQGRALWPRLARDVRTDIQLFTLGGEAILRMIEQQDYDTLSRRPALGKGAKVWLLLRAVVGKLRGWGAPGGGA